MNSSQLEDLMERELGPVFAGVFPRDELPLCLPVPSAIIVNTQKSYEPGEHWLAFYFDIDGTGEFFDSSGKSPQSYPDLYNFLIQQSDSSISWPSIQVQGFGSSSCGQHCVYYLCNRYWDLPMNKILANFSAVDLVKNDCLVVDWLNDRYDLDTECHPWPGLQSCTPLIP